MSLEDPYEGQKFSSFEVLKKYLEEYGQRNFVKFWIRSSHTISSLKSKTAKRLNPNLKYVCMKFACIFGGEKIRCRGSGIRKSTTYRNLGCPCMINAVIGEDGNHVKLETVVLEHNHALCKSLYDSLKRSKNKIGMLEEEIKANGNSLLKKNSLSQNVISKDLNVAENESSQKNETGQTVENDVCEDPRGNETVPDGSNNFQNYVKKIQEKYGSNIKIIVVNKEEVDPETVENEVDSNGGVWRTDEEDEEDPDMRETIIDVAESLKLSSEKICRLCLSTSNKLTPIFKPSLPLESTLLSFKIMSCASIEVSNDDELPSNICSTCEEILEIAYNFRKRCEDSDSILRKACSSRFVNLNGYTCKNKLEDDVKLEIVNEEADVKKEESPEEMKNESESVVSMEKDFVALTGMQVYARYGEACPVCGNVFDTYSDMIFHLKEHDDIENLLLTCNLCSVIFTTVKALAEHLVEHVGSGEVQSKVVACSKCDMTFLTEEEAKEHEITHEPKEETKTTGSGYLCNVCGKILKSKDRFQSHKNTHEGLRPHICLKCGRGFADRKNMHQHYDIVHLRKAKHECPICHKRFYAPTKMKSHITMHYGVKPYACDLCNKTFRLRMNMIKHKKTHSNERPHKCDKCNAAFIDKNLLTRHSYVHGGVRPYVCPFCAHRFTLKFNLKKHMASGRCNGKVKEENCQFGIEEWEQTGGDVVLVEEKCGVSEQEEFEGENETIRMDIMQE